MLTPQEALQETWQRRFDCTEARAMGPRVAPMNVGDKVKASYLMHFDAF